MTSPNVETIEAFSLRLPPALKDRIHQSAKANRRSLNAQMLVLMEQSLSAADAKTGETA